MADNQILIFFPEPLLFLPFPGNIMINGIDPALPAFVLDKGKVCLLYTSDAADEL